MRRPPRSSLRRDRPVTPRLSERCRCGHRYPEHSAFGTCRGCLDCTNDPGEPNDPGELDDAGELSEPEGAGGPDGADQPGGSADPEEHPYRQCPCRSFRSTGVPAEDAGDLDG